MLRIVLFLALAAISLGVEFLQWEGKSADPCNRYLVALDPDCPPHGQMPIPTVTIQIPSETSTSKLTPGVTTPLRGFHTSEVTLNMTANALPVQNYNFLALSNADGSCSSIDTSYAIIVISPQTGLKTTSLFFTLPTTKVVQRDTNGNPYNLTTNKNLNGLGWDSEYLEIEDRPRSVCWTAATTATTPTSGYRYTGFKIGVVWSCETSGTVSQCGNRPTTDIFRQFLTPLQRIARQSRSVCCKSAVPGSMIGAGQCINPAVQECCGGAATEVAHERCCNAAYEVVAQLDGNCPCISSDSDCPVGERCCLPTKYSELDPTKEPLLSLYWPQSYARGNCYKPVKQRCCDTGSLFDPGSQQCCKITGVTSINVPCPCNTNSDCVTQSYPLNSRTSNFTCCRQTAPDLESRTALEQSGGDQLLCSIYANYPSGQGTSETLRCRGRCMDPRYQTCCNGAVCMSTYEICCNSSCCNKWTATCFFASRSGSPGNRYNTNFYFGEFSEPEVFEACSAIEHINTIKGFWIFVLPSMLLLVSHVGLALVLVFAAKATPRSFSKLEFVMMALALVICYLVMPLYFAPVWKYPIWVIFAQLLVFLTATARIKWLNVLCVVIQAVTLIYLFDPFHGNAWLTLSSNRVWYVNEPDPNLDGGRLPPRLTRTSQLAAPDDVMTSGVLHSIVRSWHTVDLTRTQEYCYHWYDYFKYDPALRDLDRVDNPEITMFGYCSRGWVTALMIFSYFVMTGVLVQLVLSLLGVFIRFRRDSITELEAMEREAEY